VRALFLGAIGLLLVTQLGLLWQGTGLAWLVIWLLLFFVGFNILEASLPSLVSRVAPGSAKGLALGIYNTTQAIGLFVGGAAGGIVAARWGSGAVFGGAAAILASWWLVAISMREIPKRSGGEPVPV
jgi:predicted MFS family arabinose efflux permease